MTPVLIQSVSMLGLPAYDLYELVVRELNENPVLEAAGEGWGKSSLTDILEKTVAVEKSLTTNLLEQAQLYSGSSDEYNLLESLISLLDQNGFLTIKPEMLPEELERGPEEIKKALKTINGFNPPGCGTTGSRESLLVQAKELNPGDHILREMIKTHLEDIGAGNYGKISRSLNISEEAIIEREKLLKKLNPFPGKNFTEVKREYIIPDIRARVVKGMVVVELNESWIPEIAINPLYSEMVKGKEESDEKKYLIKRIESARNLINTIKKRRDMLFNVAEEILDHQKDFIFNGFGYLLPLLQKDVAERTGLHESTISRIINKKYVELPRGIVPLKVFFSRSVSPGGCGHRRTSADFVRKKIFDIVRNEDKTSPLKDDEIVSELKKSGLIISRRAVSKYRRILRIETAGKRKTGG